MEQTNWDRLASGKRFMNYLFPKVSIVVPTFNCTQSIGLTLESILDQEYPDLEVILVDAQSTDRTLLIIKSFIDERVRVCSVTSYHRYEMLNKGISIASGKYINCMFPGDFFIHPRVCKHIMSLAIDNELPNLVYGGCLIRDGRTEVKMLYRPLSLDVLKAGLQPTSIQSCWLLADTFKKIGKFNTDYSVRGGFDLLCRFYLRGDLSFASTTHVLTDYDLRGVSRKMVIRHFIESLQSIYRNFGFRALISWLFTQRDFYRYLQLLFRSLRSALFGKRS